ncbi:MAG TPA: Ni/Fe hydrogenase, partial [Mobilitalea sp.]|nr:Ni/Fe hydrogenase [Mobilitalea sp.]
MLTGRRLAQEVRGLIKSQSIQKMNAIWLEATGCSGNIISLLNGEYPYFY